MRQPVPEIRSLALNSQLLENSQPSLVSRIVKYVLRSRFGGLVFVAFTWRRNAVETRSFNLRLALSHKSVWNVASMLAVIVITDSSFSSSIISEATTRILSREIPENGCLFANEPAKLGSKRNTSCACS